MDISPLFGLSWPGLGHLMFWQPITYMFVHGGVLHILFNMMGLFFFGPETERALSSALHTLAPLAASLTVAGFLRDSQMNSSYASSKRLLVDQSDLDGLREALGTTATTEHLIQFRLTESGVASQFETAYREAGLEANGPTITWSLFVLVNSLSAGMTAAVLLLVTVLLVAIALLCVRFTLLTTIEHDYREIGVLKAIGVRDRDLRRLYSRPYLVMATGGAVVGLMASFALNQVLLRDVHLFMGPTGRTLPVVLLSVVLSALAVGVVGVAVRRLLRRLAQVSPVQAIRTGAASTGATRGRSGPAWLSVARSPLRTNLLLGLRDLARQPGLYVVPLVIYTLASSILILPQNLYTTARSPEFITYMGAGVSDLRVETPPRSAVHGTSTQASPGRLAISAPPALWTLPLKTYGVPVAMALRMRLTCSTLGA